MVNPGPGRQRHTVAPYWRSLENCPNGDHSNFVDAVTIIRKELMPRIAG
jgi:hypothetical protein